MNRLIKILSSLLLTLALIQCSTFDKTKWINNKKVIEDANKNKQLITLSLKNVADKKNNNIIVGFVKDYDLSKDLFYFQNIKSKNCHELYIKNDIDTVSFFNSEETTYPPS